MFRQQQYNMIVSMESYETLPRKYIPSKVTAKKHQLLSLSCLGFSNIL